MELLRQAARLVGIKNRQYETLTEITSSGQKVRVWRTAPSLQDAAGFDHRALSDKMQTICATIDKVHWQAELMKLPHVACVAIVDSNGNGISSYPDWG